MKLPAMRYFMAKWGGSTQFYALEKRFWPAAKTTNRLERLFGELKRRIRAFRRFPNTLSCQRWLFALLFKLNKIQDLNSNADSQSQQDIWQCRKNRKDHTPLSNNCIVKRKRSRFLGGRFTLQIRQPAKAIKTYSTVQTGAKIQSGGFRGGLWSPAYQLSREVSVPRLPSHPTDKQTTINRNSWKIRSIQAASTNH